MDTQARGLGFSVLSSLSNLRASLPPSHEAYVTYVTLLPYLGCGVF
ncbi:MAG: hypothetical protein ABR920_02035 [Terriglobales bacterium]